MQELETVWSLLSRNNGLRYFAKRGDLTLAGRALTAAHLEGIVNSNPGFDWYVGLNPTRGHGTPPKARSRDVIEWAWVLLDIDPVSQGADPEKCLNLILDTHHLHEVSVVIDSGRGRQAWISVLPVALRNPSHRGQVEAATSAWLFDLDPFAFNCRVDVSCRDLSRVARLPGTLNSKSGRMSSIISLPTSSLDPERIMACLPPEQGTEHRAMPDASLAELLPALTETAISFLTEGVFSPGRHSACYACARACAQARVFRTRALDLLLTGASLCHPPLPSRDVVRILNAAFDKESS